jgi:dimethylhistidine N-methyltransferase
MPASKPVSKPDQRPASRSVPGPTGHGQFLYGQFLEEVVAGLSRPRKSLPGKYLWDETGSEIFDRICATGDYYLTRSETALLNEAAPEIAACVGERVSLVEYGSGASRKSRILLDALAMPRRYIAIDISAEYLRSATRRIAAEYPSLDVLPVVADYAFPFSLSECTGDGPILGFFPGSTIGNFDQAGVIAFLERARETLGGGWFLVGHDCNKDKASLRRAYGEADGLMAALHLNLLSHVNRALGADFDASDFRHDIRIEEGPCRVEAHLVARRDTSCRIGGRRFSFAQGERLHTDTSYKMDVESFLRLARAAGWTARRSWLGSDGKSALHLLAGRDPAG